MFDYHIYLFPTKMVLVLVVGPGSEVGDLNSLGVNYLAKLMMQRQTIKTKITYGQYPILTSKLP